MVFDARAAVNSSDWRDSIFQYRAQLPEDIKSFKLCGGNFDLLERTCRLRTETDFERPRKRRRQHKSPEADAPIDEETRQLE